ncbi:MAG TPA: hypothetical protein PLP19_13485 [bacterium]|nr:hypothetical protein [bacterium]HPN44500.1 hypothetical protein [bacterium]
MKSSKSLTTSFILTILFFAFTMQTFAAEPLIPDEKTRTDLVNYYDSICQWIIKADLRSGELKITEKRRTSIFINSNLARVLVAGYEITGKQEYLEEALLWFDRLVSLQQITIASDGREAGWWGDFTPKDNIYLGDAGTSATALAVIVRYADGERREKYMKALELYANFVIYGTKEDPQGLNRGGSNGWIIREGENAGAIGCGYYKGELSQAPYTISTSVTGAAFFSCMYKLTGNREYLEIAENAVNYLLNVRDPFGEFPYILHNFQLDEWPLDTMSYMADGIISCYINSDDEEFKKSVGKRIARSIQWLLNRQEDNGVWGEMRSEDQQRSQGVLNLLVWYYHDIAHYPQIAATIRANYNFFLNPKNSSFFGVNELPITTGFVGLGIAEVIEPGITYRLVNE